MATPPVDAEAFRAFEHAGWEQAALPYRDAWVPLTRQAIAPLLDAVGAGPGVRLLDAATGLGALAAAAAARGARATGIDFAAAMIGEARRHYPHVDFRQGDADDLPFPDGSFDAVVIGFGLLHFARPDRALAEAHRVLRAGGRAAFTVWAAPETAVGFEIVLGAVQACGDLDVPLPPGPPFFRFSDPAECRRTLLALGFSTPSVVQLPQTWSLPAPDGLFEAMRHATVRTAGLLRAQAPAGLEAIRQAVCDAARPYARQGLLVLPMPAVLAAATKP
ncbi:MAG: methyltransferase domain-containing protein [Chloroflexi bacterium]|nr:methyltransferase domain-containing protein [Chloroflexota bacterium]